MTEVRLANELPSRRVRKKEEFRSRIVTEAVRLFGERGIDAVTVDEIAAAADVGKGTLYNYFRAKEDIVLAFMVDIEGAVQGQLRDFTSRKRDVGDVLIGYVQKAFELKAPYHAFVRVFLAHMFLRTEQFLPYMVEMQKAIDPPLEALFMRLRERKAIRDDVPVAQLVMVFKTVQLGLMAVWAVEGPPFSGTERTMKTEIRLFCEGLRTKSGRT
jgi:AcrR family transcriptional regulator